MNTPALDSLLAQATQESDNIILGHRQDMAKRRVIEILGTHATEIVGVLKLCMSASHNDGFIYQECSRMLSALEQEATCQKRNGCP